MAIDNNDTNLTLGNGQRIDVHRDNLGVVTYRVDLGEWKQLIKYDPADLVVSAIFDALFCIRQMMV